MRRTRTAWLVAAAMTAMLSGTLANGSQFETKKPSSGPDPYAGMSSQEREASDVAAWKNFEARYKKWLSSRSFTTKELATMHRRSKLSFHTDVPASLQDAVSTADTVVSGVVDRVSFEPYRAVLHIIVEETIKGNATRGVTIVQPGGPWPEPDFVGATLSIDEASPLLLVGERAFFLLQPYPGRPEVSRTESVAGVFKRVDGRVEGPEDGSFTRDFAGKSEAEFSNTLRALSR